MENLTIIDHPLIQHKLTEMRKKNTSSNHFRTLLKEISLLLAYEITRNLPMETISIETPLEKYNAPTLAGKKLALISILRAGNDSRWRFGFNSFRTRWISWLYRNEKTLQPVEYYSKVPSDLHNRVCIVVDPMLATGGSVSFAVDYLKKKGAKDIRFLCLLAAPEGVEVMKNNHPDVQVFTASLDKSLNEIGYILPGLGDAGDRLYGTK